MDNISRYDSDYEERFEEYRQNILVEDNKDKFLSFLKEYYNPGLLPPDVVRDIVTCSAEKCAKALLEEETGYRFDIHSNTQKDYYDEYVTYVSPLHLVSHPGLCRLLLSHGAQPNIRTTHKTLPLNYVLGGLGDYVYGRGGPPTFDPADHIFRVIIKLCLPNLRGRLEVVRMLLELTEEAEKEISGYATQGEVIKIAALLIVDRKKVMPSVLKALFPNDLDLEGSLAFRNFLLTLENQKVNCRSYFLPPGFDDDQKVSKLALMMPIFHLLGIFAKVGDRIDAYLKQEQWKKVSAQTVANKLAFIFLDAGFSLKEHDYNLSILNEEQFSSCHHLYMLAGYPSCKEDFLEMSELKVPARNPGISDPPMFGQVTSPSKHGNHRQSLTVELENLCKHEYLNDWSSGNSKSFCKLVILLCLPELQGGILKNIRTLALKIREDLEEFSCLCLKEGKLVQLAALLMVARERLLGKTSYISDKGGFSSDPSCMPLHDCLMREMSAAIFEETISKATFQSNNSVENWEARKKLMSSAHLLLKVFATAGYCIDRYLKSDSYRKSTSNVQVAEDVTYLLRDTGFYSKKGFFGKDMSDMKCFPNIVPLTPKQAENLRKLNERVPLGDIATQAPFLAHMFSYTKKKHVSSILSGQQRKFTNGSAPTARAFHTCRIPDSRLTPLTENVLPWKQLTMFALSCKRSIKLIKG